MPEFRDRVVLVTGAGQNPGAGVAQAFAEEGAMVAAHDVSPVHLDKTVNSILDRGGQVKAYVGDLTTKIAVQTMLEEVLADWQRVEVLINAAAVRPRRHLLTMDEWDWRRTLEFNLGGCFLTMQSVGRIMREQGGGVIVNIVAGFGLTQPTGAYGAYAASQLGLLSLTTEAAAELTPLGVRVHAVGPCLEVLLGQATLRQREAALQQIRAAIPACTRSDLPELVLHLCSDAAADLSGLLISVPASCGGAVDLLPD